MNIILKIKEMNVKLIQSLSRKNNVKILGFWSLCESVFFPIPPDIGLVAMASVNKNRAFYYATITTITSVIGGVIGYIIGMYLFQWIGKTIIELYGLEDSIDWYLQQFQDNGALIVFVGGFSPIPYKFITIASGLASVNIYLFIIFSIISRGLRYFIIAGAMYLFGYYAKKWLEDYFVLLTVFFTFLVIIGFFVFKMFF